MKRKRNRSIELCVLGGMLVSFLYIMPAAAQALDDGFTEAMQSVSCDQCIAGNEYTLLILDEDADYSTMTAEDICFIDQLKADSDGKVEAVFLSASFSHCKVLLGGTFADSASSPRVLNMTEPAVRNMLNAPDMLSVIEAEAFMATEFTYVYLGENVTEIQAKAFANCQDLRYIYIPDSTVIIDRSAFENCNNLTIGCHEGSYAEQYASLMGLPVRIIG